MTLPPRLGLVVNPIAGIGGPAGLKGSDGLDIQRLADARGGRSHATERAVLALRALPAGTVVACSSGSMGADAVIAAGLTPLVVHTARDRAQTTASDTQAAVRGLVAAGCGLILFAGGDGTARDLATALAGVAEVGALGIPCGVKMYSSCFALSPQVAGRMAASWLASEGTLEPREVLDVPEDLVRQGMVVPQLFGELRVPQSGGRTQARKQASLVASRDQLRGIARAAVAQFMPGISYLLGPGSTVDAVASELGVARTPLGFDVVRDGRLVQADASEADLARIAGAGPARAVVTVIGGQGFLLGRGNQQLSAQVLRLLGGNPLLVVATSDKLRGLAGPLLIDTGDAQLDRQLAGHLRVITGIQDTAIVRAVAATNDGVNH